jgi:pimeloyl-ACP methyl ester carboxylesterase
LPLLIIFSFLAGLFAILGLLSWLILYLLKLRDHGVRIVRITVLSFLVLFPVFLFIILPVTFSHLLANASTRPMDRLLGETPNTFGCRYSEVRFPSRDGLLLKGWLIEGDLDKTPIVFSHGLFRNRQEVLERACRLSCYGHPVLVFDLRCHGESQRKAISLGFKERLDVLGATDFLNGLQDAGGVIIAGVSMGAVASILAAGETAQTVTAIIADSPFDELSETIGRHTQIFLGLPRRPFSDLFIWNLTREADFEAGQLNTLAEFESLVKTPVLLIYGEADQRMTANVARRLYDAIPWPEKKLVFFEGAGHGGSFASAPDEYIHSIVDFLSQHGRK